MKVKDIIAEIEDFAPLSIQEKWDNSGLCIGSPEAEVSSVLIGLDCTPELVDEAIECGADMIVTHHPLIFSGLKKISPDDLVGAAVIKAVTHGISVYAAHTNADKVIAGVSGAMAARIGLEDVTILDEDGEGTGLGVAGNLPEPMTPAKAV
jgi:dinuclear metal center YbgI/SA1388 family protein